MMKVMPLIGVSCLAAMFAAGAAADEVARKAFAEMIRRHRGIPGVIVDMKLKISVERHGQRAEGREVEGRIMHNKGGDGLFKAGGYTLRIADRKLYASHADNAEQFFTMDDLQYVQATIVYDCFGSFDRAPFPHLAIFWGVDDIDELLMEFYIDTPGLKAARLVDRVVKGESVRTLVLEGPDTVVEVNLDPTTFFLDSIRQEITGGMLVPPGSKRTNEYVFAYEVRNEPIPAAEFAFDPGTRLAVDAMAQLVKEPVAAPLGEDSFEAPARRALMGSAAPDFTLEDIDGQAVNLESLRGQVVVIDFWAVWCPPCVQALPELHKVAAWAEAEGLPVKVFALNTFEHGASREDKVRAVREFWTEAKHTLPVLMDDDGAVAEAYGVRGIPATFVIGLDGAVVAEHSGFGADYAELLKKEIKSALEM